MSIKLGFAMCGSFCTFSEVLTQMQALQEKGYDVYPIMSYFAYTTDTRFGTAQEIKQQIKLITGKEIISTIDGAEPIGPKNYLDALLVAPCTGNTLGKLAWGITDTPVTMAVKAHLRNKKPVILAVSTNDGLGGSGKNIGALLNMKNIYFVPMHQDDSTSKPFSMVAKFGQIDAAIKSALEGKQIQPILL